MARFRQLKKDMAAALKCDDWREALASMNIDPDTRVNPLLALRLNRDDLVCWRAVFALGEAVAELADTGRMEQARIHMRTFMWFMNEESGNLGWGIPEAMARVMALNNKLAKEFSSILASYVYCDKDCDGNFLDHPELRRGVFWGLGHLAEHRPEFVANAMRFLVAGIMDEDALNRVHAASAINALAQKGVELPSVALDGMAGLVEDTSYVRVYKDDAMVDTTVAQVAGEFLVAA